jgi:phospholipid/cholesterol/gamma-HCH transport system substrate-binding protein
MLQLQGVTGLLYIDLAENRSVSTLMPPVAGLNYPVIRSSPSGFDVFLASLPELVAEANNVVRRANRLLSDANVAAVSGALDNLSKASNGLPQTLHDLNALIADLRGASAELGATARSAHNMIDAVAPDVRASAQQLHTITDRLADASGQIDRVIAENRQDLRSFARDGLPELERFLREGRAAAQDIRALANSLRENPAQLIYEPPERGMEIPR